MPALQPVYLALDVAGGSIDKQFVVRSALPALIEVVRGDPMAYTAVRVVLLTFDEQPTVLLGLTDPAALRTVPPPVAGTGRVWRRAFRRLRDQIQQDRTTASEQLATPVVLFVTDGPPDDSPGQWRPDFDALLDIGVTVVPVGYGTVPFPLLEELGRPAGIRPRPGVPLDVIADTVRGLRDGGRGTSRPAVAPVPPPARQLPPASPSGPPPAPPTTPPTTEAPPAQRAGRPSGTPPPAPPAPSVRASQGAFEPFVVGDGGRAAALVRTVQDRTDPYLPDFIVGGVEVRGRDGRPAVDLRAASVRGLSHRYYGKVRQDHYAFRSTPDDRYLVAAVSDGVSDAARSHDAAAVVCEHGCELLSRQLADLPPEKLDWAGLASELTGVIVRQWARTAQVDEHAATARDAVATHAATAVFAVVDLEPVDGRLHVQVAGVGDSPAWVLRDGGNRWESLQPIKNAGATVASSGTRAFPLVRGEMDGPYATELGPADVLVLMTDGIADPLGDGRGEVGRFLAQVWASPPAPLGFAAQVDFARKSHDDDRTAVAIWPEGRG